MMKLRYSRAIPRQSRSRPVRIHRLGGEKSSYDDNLLTFEGEGVADLGHGHKGTNRVVRGGSWNNNARNARSATRNWIHAAERNNNVGFRLARVQKRVG